jgi:hypothetical protein
MKLSDLKEMAVCNSAGYDLSQEEWDIEILNFKNSISMKQINENKIIKKIVIADKEIYTLWINNSIVSFAKFSEIKIAGTKIKSLLFVASDPKQNKMGYATELVWELHLTLEDDIYIGGAFSNKGEKLVAGLVKMYKKIRNSEPLLINYITGEKTPYTRVALMTKNKLGVLLEDCCFFEAYKEVGTKRFWLNDNIDLLDYP